MKKIVYKHRRVVEYQLEWCDFNPIYWLICLFQFMAIETKSLNRFLKKEIWNWKMKRLFQQAKKDGVLETVTRDEIMAIINERFPPKENER